MKDGRDTKRRPLSRLFLRPYFGQGPITRFRTDASAVGTSFSFALSALKKKQGGCPKCGAQRSIRTLEAIEHETGDRTYVLGCSNCDHTESVQLRLAEVASQIDQLRIGEHRFLVASACAAAFGFVYYFTTGYLFTLIGALFISATLLTNALHFRYRVWQLVHAKVFSGEAPLKEWLRHEFS